MNDELYRLALELHRKHRGKLEVTPKVPIRTRKDLSLAYTPGVARVCREIEKDKDLAYRYTIKGNSVAIVTDGSAVLGLGNIGGHAAIPVMEGKSILFKRFANIDAFPLCFDETHPDFIDDIKSIAPVFGGINLEDIASPRCFEVEDALQGIGIPVMHDDQHGTAVTVLAALLNACKVTGRELEDLTVVISGAGAAGFGIVRLLHCLDISSHMCTSVKELFVCDSKGIIHRSRKDVLGVRHKYVIAQETNHEKRAGGLAEAMEGADAFIGVSAPGIVNESMVRSMAKDPIVMALANPVPEIMPDKALKAGASVVATGRSDFPNQANNVLAFPGIFRGALDAFATHISDDMKLAAAHALADYVRKPGKGCILPDILDLGVTRNVASAVKKAAIDSGCARPGLL